MDTSFSLEVLSPQGQVFHENVKQVSVPTIKGEITILPHHTALFVKLTEGEMKIETSKGERIIAVVGGFLEIKDNVVTILSDYAVKAESIQAALSDAKKKRIEELMKQKESGFEFALHEKELQRLLLELKISSKVKMRSRPQ